MADRPTQRMTYVTADGPEADGLSLTDGPGPVVGEGDVLVAVHTIGLNRSDIKQRRRGRPPQSVTTDILGIEFSGVVEQAGATAGRFSPGDEVCGLVPGGAYAEYVAVDARHVLPLPAGTDLRTAAAVPEAFLTAWSNMIKRAELSAAESVLIHGGASGVGSAAIQLAVRGGAHVIATASSERKAAACHELGAAHVIDYTSGPFLPELLEVTDGHGVDVVVDLVGAPYLEQHIEALRPEGRLVIVSLLGGSKVELDLKRIQSKRLFVTGSQLRSRSSAAKATLTSELEAEVWPGFAEGRLRPVIDSVVPWERIADAHRRLETGDHVGKILIEVSR